jgi:hypothetical protein
VINSLEDVAGQQLTGEKLGRARSSGIVAPLPDEVGAATVVHIAIQPQIIRGASFSIAGRERARPRSHPRF